VARTAKKRLVVTFSTTGDAIAAEQSLAGLKRTCRGCGRLIPVPREISAGCGMAWKDELELKDEIVRQLEKDSITPEVITTIEFLEKSKNIFLQP
jgi:hypothetical protein